MGLSVANILLEVTGDSDDARRELEAVSRDLALFGRQTAEAEAELDTTGAQASLNELKARLAEFSADDHSTEVNILIAKAQADLAVLQAELSAIDKKEITVDVDVRRGIVEKVASLTGQIERLGAASDDAAGGGLRRLISGFFDAELGVGRWSASLASILQIGPAVVAAIIAIVGQIVAVVASAASAVGGIGALAVAFASALVPGILLGVGAIARFKATADTAGSAAHALTSTVGELVDAFTKATAGGADAVFRGLSDAIRELAPMVENLGPAFTRLGKAGGDAFRLLAAQFSSPAWQRFFTFTTDSLAKLTPLFARSFGAFAAILRNIATAAMPFLIQGFSLMAKGLEAVADKTSDIGSLRDSIGGMVDSLRAWGHLLGGIVELAGAFVAAFAPIGDSIVASLGDGAENLAAWLRSSEGLHKVKQFFEDTGPLASELGELVLNVTLAFVQLGQLVAPALTPVVHVLNLMFSALNKVLSWLNDKHFTSAFLQTLTSVILPITALVGLLGDLKDVASDAFNTILQLVGDVVALLATPINFVLGVSRDVLGLIRSIWKTGKGIVSNVINFVLRAPRTVLGTLRDIWRTAKNAISNVINFVLKAPRTVLGAVRSIWQSAKGIVSTVISFLLRVPRDAVGIARDVWTSVKGIITTGIDFVIGFASDIVDKARAIWDAVNNALPDITLNIHIPTPSVPNIDVPGLAGGVRDMASGAVRLVGEEGPELRFVPQGADIFTASETRRILRALAGGASMPAGAAGGVPALAGAGGHTEQNFNFITPGTGNPDPRIAMAQAALFQRQKGRRT